MASGSDGGDGADRAAVFGEHPDQRFGVPLRGDTVALVLGDTGEKEALLAVEKLRRLLADVRFPGKDKSVEFCAGLAQAVMRQHFDPVDIVTEVANRADHALELAVAQGAGKVVSQAPQFAASAAVA
jgi:GGDEF domain-containing protein